MKGLKLRFVSYESCEVKGCQKGEGVIVDASYYRVSKKDPKVR